MIKLFAGLLALGLAGAALAQNPQVELRTSRGAVLIELYPDKAPRTVANFLQYVKSGFYDGTVFHRVIDGFMIQGGGFEPDMKQKATREPIQNEASNRLPNITGSIAMARTSDPNSASAQFFINLRSNTFLNFKEPTPQGYGYAVFGQVVRGMEVVNEIAKVRTGPRGPHGDVPLEPVVIQSAAVLQPAKGKGK
ncbi:MAG: peptidyl-prolyl cis-trans isomerase [Burkholderiales bacterium]|nr:peptidyl-prolyl cis-trans isomerase [Burkholderiales bacterium]